MKLVKYFLQKRAVTILLLVLVLAGGLFSYFKMGKLEDAPFTIKQALVLTSYPGASPAEVQSQVTDILEEAIQSLGELYYLKTENRAGLSKITVYVKKEIRAEEMQQLWDKLRRKVNDVQDKLPAGAGTSIVNDDFGDVGNKYPLFWVKYDDLAPFLAKQQLMTSNVNNAAVMSAEDYFTKNLYQGKIYKTNNMQGNTLAQYCPSDTAMAKEQKRIEAELAAFEKNIWGNQARKDSLDSIAKAEKNMDAKTLKKSRNRRSGSASKPAKTSTVKKRRSRGSNVSSGGSARVTVRRERH